jgi:hypothetical protein
VTLSEAILLLATVISALAGVAFVWAMIQTYKGQMNAQVFTEYSNRYDQILASLPLAAWEARVNSESALPEPSPELTLCVLRYLNLSSEEFYLYQRGYLQKDVWEIWQGELERTLRSPLLRREWQALAPEFVSYPEFARYVEVIQKER